MATLQDPAGGGSANVVDAVTPGSLVGKKAALVTLTAATITVSDAAEGVPGAAAPAQAIQIGGTDGTNLVAAKFKPASTAALATDPALVVAISPNNTVPVSAASLPLPTGASTSALQTQPGVDIGDVTVNNAVGAAAVNIQDGGNSITVDGTVAVSGSVAVTGPLTDTQLRAAAVPVSAASLPLPTGASTSALQTQPGVDIGDVTVNNAAGAAAVNVQDGGNSLTVDATSLPLPTGAATEATLALIKAKTDNLDVALSTRAVTGLTDAQLRATAVPVSGPLTDAQLRASAVPVSAASLPLPTGASTAANQTTLGSQTSKINDGTNTAAVKAASTAAVASDTALVVAISPNNALVITNASIGATGAAPPASASLAGGSVTTAAPAYTTGQMSALSLTTSGGLRVDGSGSTQPVSGTVGISGSVAVTGPLTDAQLRAAAVPVSAASLPLPAGASTETTLSAVSGKLPATLGQKAMAASLAVVIASDQGAVAISAASLPLPSGAATSANQTTLGNQTSKINDGTNTAAVKASSVAADTTDPALVVAISPNTSVKLAAASTTGYQSQNINNIKDGTFSDLTVDASGRLEAHSSVNTDETSFRDDFSGAALTVALTGTLGFTNNNDQVTGSGTLFSSEIKIGSYVAKSADPFANYGRVSTIESDTALTLETVYAGTTAAGVAGITNNWLPATGTGVTQTVATSNLTLGAGTTAAAVGSIFREGDYGPLSCRAAFSLSQRIANNEFRFGLQNVPTSNPSSVAAFRFSGTSNTVVDCVSGSSSAAADQQTTTVTLTNAGTTATSHEYKVDVDARQVTFLIDGVIVARHSTHIPGPYDALGEAIVSINGGAPASNTNLIVDYLFFQNIYRIQTDSDFAGARFQTITPPRTRVSIIFQSTATATADTLLSLVKSTDGTPAGGATSIAVSAGKTLRITAIEFNVRAGAAAAAFATFTLRINPAGAAVIGSQSELRFSLGNTEAVIGAARGEAIAIPDGMELSGTTQLAVSAIAQATTNILSVTMTGYEY